MLDVIHKYEEFSIDVNLRGVWRYKSLVHPSIPWKMVVTRGEGDTETYSSEKISQWAGCNNLWLKHEGENPTGSFKDRGVTVAISEAKRLGCEATICASTGNTSASASSYSALAGLQSYVLIPFGNISESKLAQAVSYGSKIIDVPGDFDKAMSYVRNLAENNRKYYVMNSINPWRIEGQKTITFEIMEKIRECDFISMPAGNLGNTAAAGKALKELKTLGVIEKVPRIVAVQAEGASPFYNMWKENSDHIVQVKAETIASAIRIGNPVNWEKAMNSIKFSSGIVARVSDNEIREAKWKIDSTGIGCEPASAASLAGVKKLVEEGTIDRSDKVACVLTGHILKDLTSMAHNVTHESVESFIKELQK